MLSGEVVEFSIKIGARNIDVWTEGVSIIR